MGQIKLLIAAACLMATAAQSAPEDYAVPAGIVAATLAVGRVPALRKTCIHDPCNTISHAAIGGLAAWYVNDRHGWRAALLTAIAIGVGKELLDKNFDPKDAAATSMGGAIVVGWKWEW